jgi:hypothetical protein
LPLAAGALFVLRYGVDVPFWDEWRLVPYLVSAHDGTLRWSDFWAQYNEHRSFFPMLILAGMALASHWNIWWELALNLALAWWTFHALRRIRRDSAFSVSQGSANLFLACLVFSPRVWEGWLHGFVLCLFLVNASLAGALVLLESTRAGPTARILGAASLCWIASGSQISGLLAFVALLPMVAAMPGPAVERWRGLALWSMMFSLVVIGYARGYSFTLVHSEPLAVFERPLHCARYFLRLLGGWALSDATSAAVLGLGQLLAYLLLVRRCWKCRGRPEALALLPWMCLGAFALLSCALIAAGRAVQMPGIGPAPRYLIYASLLPIALSQAGAVLTGCRRRLAAAFAITLAVLLALSWAGWPAALAQGRAARAAREQGRRCLEFVEYLGPELDDCLRLIHPFPSKVRGWARDLERIGLGRSRHGLGFVAEPLLNHGQMAAASSSGTVPVLARGQLTPIWGWAILPRRNRPAQEVWFSRGPHRTFMAVTTVGLESPAVVAHTRSPALSRSGWKIRLSTAGFPDGESSIFGWVYDGDQPAFMRLRGAARIRIGAAALSPTTP